MSREIVSSAFFPPSRLRTARSWAAEISSCGWVEMGGWRPPQLLICSSSVSVAGVQWNSTPPASTFAPSPLSFVQFQPGRFSFSFFYTFVSEPLIRLLLPAHAAASPLPIFPLCVSLSVVPRPAAHPYWKGTMLEKTHIFAQGRFPNTFKYNFGMTHEGWKKIVMNKWATKKK